MGLPNFFVAGAAKSGTTALYHALREHDAVYLPSLKEPHFYAYLADPSTAGHLYSDPATARERYRALYDGVTHETAVGDASTTTLVVRGTAAVIAQDVPAARIVVVLRHPVDRAFAHWAHFRAAGGEDIADFGEALRQEESRRHAGFPFTYQYLGWGLYSAQLPPFFECFGRERVLVHLYDELCADSGAVLQNTLRFLGVDDPGTAAAVGRHNEMPVPRYPALQRALDGKGRAGRRLRQVIPARVARGAARWTSEHLSSKPALDPGVRAAVTEQLSEEISLLEQLIDRDLSAWRA